MHPSLSLLPLEEEEQQQDGIIAIDMIATNLI
jgi:hypothetical protein